MSTNTSLLHSKLTTHHLPLITASSSSSHQNHVSTRRNMVAKILAATAMAVGFQGGAPLALLAHNWGTRSFIWERFFQPGLSPEDAVERIKQTAEGLHSIREMVENMSWRYVIFYIRLKSAYLSQDLKNALSTLPENRRKEYVETANELVDNMAEVKNHYYHTLNFLNCSF